MREFLKGVCVITLMVGGIGAGIAWVDDHPTSLVWSLRIAFPLLCLTAVIAFLLIHFRADEVPDYLWPYARGYFDRGGLCFSFSMSADRGVCYLHVRFQNRYERPCVGHVAIRPFRGLFRTLKLDTIAVEIHADAAAFGVASIAVPIPTSCQGTRQKFEVGESVVYPDGKGRMLRFRDGLVIRADSNFGDTFRTAMAVAGALGGAIVLTRPAYTKLNIPSDVADELPTGLAPTIQTQWTLGDPPLPSALPAANPRSGWLERGR